MEYNNEKVYKDTIKEQVSELIMKCRIAKIPCFISIAVGNTSDSTAYINEAVTPNSLGVKLTDDKISQHINVMNGFKTVPYSENLGDNGIDISNESDWMDYTSVEEIVPD